MADTNQLQVPVEARNDRKSFELLRVWIANQQQHISLRAGVWDDPAAWGMMLADLAGHIANALHQTAGIDREQALAAIRGGIDAEFASPTDEIEGELSQ
jgi:hypothetical protein